MYIEKILSPSDVKALHPDELETLASEMREALIQRGSVHAGHFGPNLGMVEATIALHYVFSSPQDKLVFDVSHQSYPHKMLTGRMKAYTDPAHYDDVSGYTEPKESEHDLFTIGHTSTSVSLASGLAKGRDLSGGEENVVAVIGDGSLSGGEAFEGLNVGGELDSNFIVVVNDNQMSIAENHGGLYQGLRRLRESGGTCSDNYFRALGYDYVYVEKGNDITALIAAFQGVKDSSHPVVVHINTQKGLGYPPAMTDKESWHFASPFDRVTGRATAPARPISTDYQALTAQFLLERMKEDPRVVALTAGTPAAMGFTRELRLRAGRQFIDVGIAEEQAVAMASGIAKAGGRPVFGVFSSFLTRACDQLQQDLCVNGNPAVILVFWASMASMNDVTHLSWWDIPLLSNIPGMVYLAPTNQEEYFSMLSWGLRQTSHPVAIRVPMGAAAHASRPVPKTFDSLNHSEMVSRGKDIALIGVGHYLTLALQAADILKERGMNATIINPRFLTGVDEEMMCGLLPDHRVVVTLEDGVVEGGFGAKIAQYFAEKGMRALCRGARKEFVDRYRLSDLLEKYRLTPQQIAEDALTLFREDCKRTEKA